MVHHPSLEVLCVRSELLHRIIQFGCISILRFCDFERLTSWVIQPNCGDNGFNARINSNKMRTTLIMTSPSPPPPPPGLSSRCTADTSSMQPTPGLAFTASVGSAAGLLRNTTPPGFGCTMKFCVDLSPTFNMNGRQIPINGHPLYASGSDEKIQISRITHVSAVL